MSKESDIKTEFTFTWEIKNYSLCVQRNGDPIISPVFRADNLEMSKWFIWFYPNLDGYVSCFLFRTFYDVLERAIEIDLHIEIIDADGQSVVSKTFEDCSSDDKCMPNSQLLKIIEADLFKTKVNHLSEDDITIQFRMVGFGQGKAMGFTARTKYLVEDNSYRIPMKYIHSTSIKRRFSYDASIYLEFTLVSRKTQEDFYINIRTLKLENREGRLLRCRISLLDAEDNELIVRTATHMFQTTEEDWKFPTFIKKSILQAMESEGQITKPFCLMVKFSNSNGFHLVEIDYAKSNTPVSSDLSFGVDCVNALQEDFRRMYTNHTQSDVKLRAGNDIFPAHRSVLSARSQVFCTMFNQDMLENQTGFVDISDIDPKTLNSFLRFIYTGIVDYLDYESASELVIVAEKYQVLTLKESCSSFLISALSDDNACEIFSLADMVGHKMLKSSAKRYILAHAAKILPSPEWQQYIKNNPQLATDILCSLTADVFNAVKNPFAK